MGAAMLQWIFQPSLFIGVPMLVMAVFLVWWGRAPQQTELLIRRLPFGSNLCLAVLDWIAGLIEGVDPVSVEQRGYVRTEFAKLRPAEIRALRQIIVSGHAQGISDQSWNRLKAIGFVESNYSGPLGVKMELREYLHELLTEYRAVERGKDKSPFR